MKELYQNITIIIVTYQESLITISNCLKNLKMAINISNKFKINSRKNKSFESLRKIKEFQKLIE